MVGMHRPGRKETWIHFLSVIESAVHKSFPFCVPEFLMSVLVVCAEMSRGSLLSEGEVYQLFLLMCSIYLEFGSYRALVEL